MAVVPGFRPHARSAIRARLTTLVVAVGLGGVAALAVLGTLAMLGSLAVLAPPAVAVARAEPAQAGTPMQANPAVPWTAQRAAATRTGGHDAPDGRWAPPVPLAPGVVLRPFQPAANPYGAGHRGVDLRAVEGAAIRSAGVGVVAFAGLVAGRPVVSVDHPGGVRTTYEPVVPSVAAGDPVDSGQPLGRLVAVASHCPPAACLHWGARRGGDYVDPLRLLSGGPPRLLPLGPRSTGAGAGYPAHPAPVSDEGRSAAALDTARASPRGAAGAGSPAPKEGGRPGGVLGGLILTGAGVVWWARRRAPP